MSEKHTPEPWMIDEANPELVVVLAEDGAYEYICDCEPYSFSNACRTDDEIEANARRIVACVNACRGIPNEILEYVATCKQSLQVPADANLISAAPEMLAVLKLLVASEHKLPSGMWDKVHAVIAKAEGRQA